MGGGGIILLFFLKSLCYRYISSLKGAGEKFS